MTISAVLLAGGKSSRMGQNKATTLVRGEPLWKNQLELLRRTQPEKVLISAQSDPGWRPADCEFAPDDSPSRGPLSGIAAALKRIRSSHLLALAIDVPFVSEEYLRKLSQQIGPGQGVVPMIEDRAEPLVAIYPSEARGEFVEALSGDDFSLQPLVRRLIADRKLCRMDVSDEDRPLFRNLNEPLDVPKG